MDRVNECVVNVRRLCAQRHACVYVYVVRVQVLDLLDDACHGLLDHIKKEKQL